jgi:hypothetical protein
VMDYVDMVNLLRQWMLLEGLVVEDKRLAVNSGVDSRAYTVFTVSIDRQHVRR